MTDKKNNDLQASNEEFDYKVFGTGTEAAKLLARLYGVTPENASAGVSYPKLKTKPGIGTMNREKWKVFHNGKLERAKHQVKVFDKKRAASVKLPKVGRDKLTTDSKICQLDFVPKRKSQQECELEIRNSKELHQAYRPPYQKAYSTESEKQRLNEIFTYKGGAALPEELTNPVVESPFELKAKVMEAKRIEDLRRKMLGETNDIRTEEPSTKNLLFEEILNEIYERRDFQLSMESTGRGDSTRDKISHEISARITKLKRIDANRAREIVARLYS